LIGYYFPEKIVSKLDHATSEFLQQLDALNMMIEFLLNNILDKLNVFVPFFLGVFTRPVCKNSWSLSQLFFKILLRKSWASVAAIHGIVHEIHGSILITFLKVFLNS